MGRHLALLIATYQYQDAGLRRLTAPAHDAESLAAVLQDPNIAGFEVTTLVNEPHHRVGEAIGDFCRDRRREDLVLLYFTGHGVKDDEGQLYFAMSNTRRDSLLFTSVSAEQLEHTMSRCPSRRQVLILDCCYSGAFPPGRIAAKADAEVHALEQVQGRGRTVLTASDATQYSFEGNQVHGEAAQSVFTRHLVAGLRDGSADLDGDGDITLDELYSYVYERVIEEMPQQRPKKLDNVEGRIIIAQNVNWSLPEYLRSALDSPITGERLNALSELDRLYQRGNPVVRSRIRDKIQGLTNDDSKMVSSAAAERLASILPQRAVAEPANPAESIPASSRLRSVVLNNRWVLDGPLVEADRGGFGDVWLAHDQRQPDSDESFVVKLLRGFGDPEKKRLAARQLRNEQRRGKEINSLFVAPLEDADTDPRLARTNDSAPCSP